MIRSGYTRGGFTNWYPFGMFGLGWRAGIVVTGDAFVFQRFGSADVVELPAMRDVPPPPMPPEHLPEHARVGLTTRRHHEQHPRRVPIMTRGVVDHVESAEQVLAAGLRAVQPSGLRRWLKPDIVMAAPFHDSEALKRIMLDMMERAGARRIFLVEYVMASAIGAGVDAPNETAAGVLVMESDWFEYGVVGYADLLCHTGDRFGVEDIAGPDEAMSAALRRRMGDVIARANADLTDQQLATLMQRGIVLCGRAAEVDGLDRALTDELGVPVLSVPRHPHVAIAGVQPYLQHLHEWVPDLTG